MKYRKAFAVAGTIFLLAFLTGCEPPEISGAISVQGSEDGIDNLGAGIILRSPFGYFHSDDIPEISTVSADLSQSNVPLAGPVGSILVKLKNGSSLQAAQTFGSITISEEIFFSNPSAVEAFLSAHSAQVDEIEVEFNVSTIAAVGPNTVVTEFKQNGSVVSGASTSIYHSPCDPVFQGPTVEPPAQGIGC